jgi:hypothetical protein
MTCPDVGLWRAWLDRETADHATDLAAHLAACPACRDAVNDLRQTAAIAATALSGLAPTALPAPADVARAQQRVAWRRDLAPVAPTPANIAARTTPGGSAPASGAGIGDPTTGLDSRGTERASVSRDTAAAARHSHTRLTEDYPAGAHLMAPTRLDMTAPDDSTDARRPAPELPTQEEPTMPPPFLLRRWRVAVAGLAAALALTFFVGTDQGRTATAQFLAQFRSQRFAVVTIEPGRERSYLAQLGNLGTVEGGHRSRNSVETLASVAEASQRVGFPVKQPDPATILDGVDPTPTVQVWAPSDFRFTLDRDKALAYFRANGQPDLQVPERYHGASLVVSIPPAAFLQYTGPGTNRVLMVGQARELEVGVEGNVTLAELRDFLLGLPGLSPETARQLRAIEDWRSTLPIPVPADQVGWQQTTIAGGPGLLLADNSGIGSGAIWQRDGRVYGVAGTARATEIQRVADSLR